MALSWRHLSQQPNFKPARLNVLSGCLRENESNGVIFDCRGSFPTYVFFSTSRKPFDEITHVPLSQTTTLRNQMFECIAISVKWRWPLGSLGFLHPPRGCWGVVFRYLGVLPGPNTNNATSDIWNSQYTFQWHCPSFFRSDGPSQHDWFTRWKKLCLCPLRLAISQVLNKLARSQTTKLDSICIYLKWRFRIKNVRQRGRAKCPEFGLFVLNRCLSNCRLWPEWTPFQ